MSGADNYTAMATHADAKAYMLYGGRLTEFELDVEGESTSWKEVGVVATDQTDSSPTGRSHIARR